MTATNLDQAIYQCLKANAGIALLVSTRIYPHHLPDDATFPAIVFSRLGLKPEYSHSGDSNLNQARVQIDSYGTTKAQSGQIDGLVRSTLSGKRLIVDFVQIQSSFIQNSMDDYDDILGAWRTITDYMITYKV